MSGSITHTFTFSAKKRDSVLAKGGRVVSLLLINLSLYFRNNSLFLSLLLCSPQSSIWILSFSSCDGQKNLVKKQRCNGPSLAPG